MNKFGFVILVLLLNACGTADRKASTNSQVLSSTEATETGQSQSESKFAHKNLLSESSAKIAIEKAESKLSIESSQSIEAHSSSQNQFMSEVKIEVEAAFCSAKAKNGKQLSKEQCFGLSSSFMLVVQAACTKDAAKTAQAWNGFIQTAQKMNKIARLNPSANGGLISDILGLALDAVGLVVDLIAAVLALDVAGVVNVAVDAINLVIDFLV